MLKYNLEFYMIKIKNNRLERIQNDIQFIFNRQEYFREILLELDGESLFLFRERHRNEILGFQIDNYIRGYLIRSSRALPPEAVSSSGASHIININLKDKCNVCLEENKEMFQHKNHRIHEICENCFFQLEAASLFRCPLCRFEFLQDGR